MRSAILSVAICCFICQAWGQVFAPTPEGDALFNQQDWAGAAREFKLVIDSNPKDGHAWFRLGSSLHRMGKFSEAADAFGHAAAFQFQAPLAMAGAARSFAAANDPDQALVWLDKAAKSGFGQIAFIDSEPQFTAVKARPEFVAIAETIRRNAKPCVSTPEYHQFDFWLGEWDVQVGGQNVARSRIEKIADGCIVQENWMPFTGMDGKSWNFYNAVSGKWEQVWMSGGSVLKLEGQRNGEALAYRGVTSRPDGSSVQHRLTFSPMTGGKVHQFWEQSADKGQTWAVAFDGIYVPRDQKETSMSDQDRRELLDHLKRSQEIFANAIRGVTTAQARFKAAPDRWSILECAEHLAQAEQLLFADAMGGLKLPTGSKSKVTKEQIQEAWGTAKQKAKSSGDYDPVGRWPDLATIQKIFDERRATTLQFVSTTDADLRGRICCGNLDIWQQVFALSEHTLRHVQQMETVKAEPGYPKQG